MRFVAVTATLVLLAVVVSATAATRSKETAPTTATISQIDSCREAHPIWRRQPGDQRESPWFGSLGGSLWASASGAWYAGLNKIGWNRPPNAEVTILATLTSGVAPQVRQTVSPTGYRGSIQPSVVFFPASGCWTVVATAGSSRIRFFVRVYPASYRLSQGCFTLQDAVRRSSAVVVARVIARSVDGQFSWIGAEVQQLVTGRIPISSPSGGFGSWEWRGAQEIELLQRAQQAQLIPGRRYLLFVTTPVGGPAGITCGSAGLAKVDGETVVPFAKPSLWHSWTIPAVVREIRAAARK